MRTAPDTKADGYDITRSLESRTDRWDLLGNTVLATDQGRVPSNIVTIFNGSQRLWAELSAVAEIFVKRQLGRSMGDYRLGPR